jgi:hypothetical protein
MKRRTDRRICLGFQWDAGSWDNALTWCAWLFTKFDRQRLHWNLPAFPPDGQLRKRASLIKALRSRIEGNGDVVIAMGFAGACHPLLNLDELDKELSWGLKNPWGTGITDVLDVRPTVLMPRMSDLLRPEAWKQYRAHGFTQVGIAGNFRPLPAVRSEGIFPYVLLPVGDAGSVSRRLRRLISSGEDLFLIMDLSGSAGRGPLERGIDDCAAALLAPGGHTFSLVDDAAPAVPALPPRLPDCRSDWSAFPAPVLRAKLAATAAIARKKKKKSEEYRELLSLLAPGDAVTPALDKREKEMGNRARLVAHMLGEVALTGAEYDVRLTGGRFCGITRRGNDILPHRPAASYLLVDGATRQYRTVSSFSFEGENGTGLREELALEGEDGATLSIEYSFRDDSPLLSVSAEILHPRLENSGIVQEYAPLAIALAEVPRGAKVEVEASAPDESAFSSLISEDRGWILIPGAAHRIRGAAGGWISIRFAPREGRRWGLPFFRIVRARGGRFLMMNPFGSYAPMPAAALRGRREHFSLFLGLEDA